MGWVAWFASRAEPHITSTGPMFAAFDASHGKGSKKETTSDSKGSRAFSVLGALVRKMKCMQNRCESNQESREARLVVVESLCLRFGGSQLRAAKREDSSGKLRVNRREGRGSFSLHSF